MLKPSRVISEVLNHLDAQFLIRLDFPFPTRFNITTALFMFASKMPIQLILSFEAVPIMAFTGGNRTVQFPRSIMHAVHLFLMPMEIGAGWKTLHCSATFCKALIPSLVVLDILAVYHLDKFDSKFINTYLDSLILWNCLRLEENAVCNQKEHFSSYTATVTSLIK
jgi:hypothetical protein